MELKEFIQLLKILADETRIRILHLLTHQELPVSELCAVLEMNQSAVSKHLIKLRLLGVVRDVRDGNFIYYSLNEDKEESLKIIHFLISEFERIEMFQQDVKRLKKRDSA